MPKAEVSEIRPQIVSIKQATTLLCRSRSVVAEMIADGRLEAVRDGGRVYVLVRSIEARIAGLQPVKPRKKVA